MPIFCLSGAQGEDALADAPCKLMYFGELLKAGVDCRAIDWINTCGVLIHFAVEFNPKFRVFALRNRV